MLALLLFGIFVFFAVIMLRGKMPALLAIPAMAILMAAVSGVGIDPILSDVIVGGASRLSLAYMAVFFGAFLGQVAILTGIAEKVVKVAAEFCGDKPLIIVFAMALVTALLFVALTGLGAVIMVGTLVLPIMISIGVPRPLAATSFIMAFGTGHVINITLWQFYHDALGVPFEEIGPLAFKILAINAVVTIVFILVYAKKDLLFATCSKEIFSAGEEETKTDERGKPGGRKKEVPAIALLTPIVPLVLHLGLDWPVIPAFLGGILYGVLTTRWREAIPLLSRAAIKGLEAAAPAIILMVGIGMLLNMSALPEVRAILEPMLGRLRGFSPWAFVLLFTALAPLVLFRGPLNPFGLGIGIYAILGALGILPPLAVMGLFMALTQVQAVCDPTNTHNVWVANYTEIPVIKITRMTLLFQMTVAFLVLTLTALLYF